MAARSAEGSGTDAGSPATGAPKVWMTPAAFLLRHGGVRRMALELSAALGDLGVDVRTVVARDGSTASAGALRKVAAQLAQHRALLAAEHPRLAHSVYYDVPLLGADALVVTVHDMIHERFDTGSRRLRLAKRRAVARASVVVADSDRTADDLVEAGARPRELVTIPLGVSAGIAEGNTAAAPLGDRRYLLYVGDRDGYKNFGLLVDALAGVPELDDLGLVIVGGPPMSDGALGELRATSGAGRPVHHVARVGDRQLGDLYRGAAAHVVTSRYEGFGLTVLEAMVCGCPVATSGGGSLSEVAGGHAFRFDPDSVADCRQAIVAALDAGDDHRRSARAYASQFTWHRAALAYRDVYDRLLSARRGR